MEEFDLLKQKLMQRRLKSNRLQKVNTKVIDHILGKEVALDSRRSFLDSELTESQTLKFIKD